MELLAIKITQRSILSIFAGFTDGRTRMAKFAYACLTRPNLGGDWYYLSWDPDEPAKQDFSRQIISKDELEILFKYDAPADPEHWFRITTT